MRPYQKMALEPVFSQTQVSEDNLAVKFQFCPEIPFKPTEECCVVSSLEDA